VWRALTDGKESAAWYYGTSIVSTFQPGAPYEYRNRDGTVALSGIVESADAPTRVTYELSEDGPLTTVVVIHDDVVEGSATDREVSGGWPFLLSNLKT